MCKALNGHRNAASRSVCRFSFAFVSTTSGGTNVVGEVLSIVRYLWGSLRLHLKVGTHTGDDEMEEGGFNDCFAVYFAIEVGSLEGTRV